MASFDSATGSYTIESAGSNLWKRTDSFRMIWKKVSGDPTLTADIALAPPLAKSLSHRKAVLIFRQALNANSAYADVAVHGSGYTALHYRPSEGAFTQEVPLDQGSPNGAAAAGGLAAPKTARLEKRGDTIALFVSMNGEPPHSAGVSFKLHFEGPYYVGLGVSAHQDGVVETATFSHVKLTPLTCHKGEARRKTHVFTLATGRLHGA